MLRLGRLFGSVLVAVQLSGVAESGNWPEFRGATGQGHSTETGLPVRWSDTENVAWRVDVPGSGWSSPIYYEGRIYLTTAVSNDPQNQDDQSLRTLCFDAKTGRTLWDVEVFDGHVVPTEGLVHPKNGHASPTPVCDGRHLFVHFGTEGTACLTMDGEIVWTNRTLRYVPRHGNGGSPMLLGDRLFVECDGQDVDFMVALDVQSGAILWKTDHTTAHLSRKFAFSTPLAIQVEGQTQIVCPSAGHVAAFAPETGREIWRVDYGDGYSVIPRPVFSRGLLYVCTGWNVPELLAIRPTGRGDVTKTHIQWRTQAGVPNTPSLLLVDEQLYLVSDRGVLTCVNALDGELNWRQRLGGNYSASPLYADGKIYLQSEQGEGVVMKPGREYQELARNQLPPRTFASYAVADSALFIRSESGLYRIEESGKP